MTTPRGIPRHIKFGLIALGIISVVTMGLFVDVVGHIRSMMGDHESAEDPFAREDAPLHGPADPPMQVKVFFPGKQEDAILASEDQTVFRSPELANRARQILGKLLEGPKNPDLYPSIPKDTKLQEVFIDDTGTAYVDFSNPISANHPGGMQNEQATVYSIVNSLTYNLPEIRQVKILVGGAENETLAGHCLLIPLEIDLSITDIAPPQQQVRTDEN